MPPKHKGEFFPSPDKEEQQPHPSRRPAVVVARPRAGARVTSARGKPQHQQNQQQQQQRDPSLQRPTAQRRSPSATFGSSPRFTQVTPDGYTIVRSASPVVPGPLKYNAAEAFDKVHGHAIVGGTFEKSERFHFFPSPERTRHEQIMKQLEQSRGNNNSRSGSKTPQQTARSRSPNVAGSGAGGETGGPLVTPRTRGGGSQINTSRTQSPVVLNRSAELRRINSAATASSTLPSPTTAKGGATAAFRSTSSRPCSVPSSPRNKPAVTAEEMSHAATLPSWTGDEKQQQQDDDDDNRPRVKRNYYSKSPALRNTNSPYRSSNNNGAGPAVAVTPRQQQKQQPPKQQNGGSSHYEPILNSARRGTNSSAAASPATTARSNNQQSAPTSARSQFYREQQQQMHQQHQQSATSTTMAKGRRFSVASDFDYQNLETFFTNWLKDARRRGEI